MRETATITAIALILVASGFLATGSAYAERPEYLRASQTLLKDGIEALEEDDSYRALTLLEQAVVANPKNANAYVGLGRVHVKLGKVKGGLKYFTVALEIEPTNLGALEAEALTFLSIGEVEDAEESLSRISRICGERSCAERDSVTSAISNFQDQKVADNTK